MVRVITATAVATATVLLAMGGDVRGFITYADAFSKDTTAPSDGVKRAKLNPSETQNRRTQRALPNPADPETARTLKCNACVAVAHELYNKLSNLQVLRHHSPKYVEMVETMDDICNMMVEDYGIAVDETNDKATLLFRSKDETTRAVTGGWITATIGDRCTNIIEQYESDIIRSLEDVDKERQIRDTMRKKIETEQGKRQTSKKERKAAAAVLDEAAQEAEIAAARDFTKYLCVKLDESCDWPEGEEGADTGDSMVGDL